MLKSLFSMLLMTITLLVSPVVCAGNVILVYGDSLSAGFGIRVDQSWPALLAERLREKSSVGAGRSGEFVAHCATPAKPDACAKASVEQTQLQWTVANASISGETTAGGRSRFAAALAQFKPKVVILELGANDGLRGLPVIQMQDNLNAMIKLAKASRARILLVGMRMPPNYGPVYTRDFEQAFVTLAKQHKIALLPFLLEPIAGQRDAFQADGLHPIAAMQSKLLDHVYPSLLPLLK